jgi:hypothetical protein
MLYGMFQFLTLSLVMKRRLGRPMQIDTRMTPLAGRRPELKREVLTTTSGSMKGQHVTVLTCLFLELVKLIKFRYSLKGVETKV